MPQIRFDDLKGVEQKTGSGLVLVPRLDLQTLVDGDGEKTISTQSADGKDTIFVRITTGEAADEPAPPSNVRLQTPSDADEVGRLLLVTNLGSQSVAFAAAAASNILGLDGGEALAAGASMLLVWTGSAWALTSQTLA